tara:strand:+ start:358 stop:624 length:267 start_codon:yes stop_codon:yes gene_type:complete
MKREQQYITRTNIAMIAIIGIVISLTINIALNKSSNEQVEAISQSPTEWIPTIEELEYMDMLYRVDANTKSDIDSIRILIDQIIKKLE